MENNYILYTLRDLALSTSFAFLLFLVFHTLSHLVSPMPNFEEFPCQYNNKHCREWDIILENKKNQLKELSYIEESKQEKNKIDKLKAEIKAIETNLKKTREARDKLLNQARKQNQTIHWYIAIAFMLVTLFLAYILPILPIQIGLIMGGLLVLVSSFPVSRFLTPNWFDLAFFLIAIILIIGLTLKFYKKSE